MAELLADDVGLVADREQGVESHPRSQGGAHELTPIGRMPRELHPAQYVRHGIGVRRAMHCGRPRSEDSHQAGCSSRSDIPCVAA